jgi:transposase
MKKQTRRKFSPEFKAKVALEAAKEQMTLSELAKKFEVNPVVISRWKAEFLANIAATFNNKPEQKEDGENVDVEKLYAQIGQLKVENDFLKKNCKKLGI